LAEQLTTRDKVLPDNHVSSQLARRWALARAITMMESTSPPMQEQASDLLTCLLHHHHHISTQQHQEQSSTTTTKTPPSSSFRIGFAGSPGSGKSSLIEAFGMYLLDLSFNTAGNKTSSTTRTKQIQQLSSQPPSRLVRRNDCDLAQTNASLA
jgi:putative protein kinase ArgK-like GTPase of G3E family